MNKPERKDETDYDGHFGKNREAVNYNQGIDDMEKFLLNDICPLAPKEYQYIKKGSIWINDRDYEVEVLDLGGSELWLLYLENKQRCSWEYEKFLEQYKPRIGKKENICDSAPFPKCNGAQGCQGCEHEPVEYDPDDPDKERS